MDGIRRESLRDEYQLVVTREGGRPWSGTRPRFAGFGRFRAEVDGVPLALPPITCTMLARLVLARGGLVDAEDLYRDAWPDPFPVVRRDQRVAVHKRIGELRRHLDPDGRGERSVLLTERSARTGYRLLLDADQVDMYRFEDLVGRAGAARDAVAVDLLIQALGLWMERPLLGLPDKAFVRGAVARLLALRERACRELVAVGRALGRTREALVALDRLTASRPDDAELSDLVQELRPGAHRIADRVLTA